MHLFRQIAARTIDIRNFPFFSELNIEAFIIENPQVLSSDTFANPEIVDSQVHLKYGRSDGDGRIDIVAKTDNGYLMIIEIKNSQIGLNNISQLTDYMKIVIQSKAEKFGAEFADFQVKGVLVGIAVEDGLIKAIEEGSIEMAGDIFGLTINRFKSHDNTENYIWTEYYEPSMTKRTRYLCWDEFMPSQIRKGIPEEILSLAKQIHDYAKVKYNLSDSCFQYTPNTVTISIPKVQRKRVFAYIIPRKKDVKIYLTYSEVIPEGALPNENPARYPDSCYILINTALDIPLKLESLFDISYNSVNTYYD